MSRRKNSGDDDAGGGAPAAKVAREDAGGSRPPAPDAAPSDLPSPPAPQPVQPAVPLRSSARVLINQRRKEERRETGAEADAAAEAPAPEERAPAALEKPRRAWEQWSPQDMAVFFEGLNEYGKNFEQIQAYFSSKSKNRGGVSKTREQIRCFYYRAWHKISPHVDFAALPQPQKDLLKKSARELYGLVNYGELRKKLGSAASDEKNLARLNELVFKGHTTFRLRGKTLRVRTPICRTLKRLIYKLEAGKNKSKRGSSSSASTANGAPAVATTLPTKIQLELRPLTSSDFFRVHGGCYQNPHLELRVDPSVKLTAVIEQLEKKWAPSDGKVKFGARRSHVPNRVNSESSPPQKDPYDLVVTVPRGVKLVRPILTPIKQFTSATLCLENLLLKVEEKLEKDAKIDGQTTEKDQSPKSEESYATGEKREPSASTDSDKPEISDISEEEVPTSWTKGDGQSFSVGELYLMMGCCEQQKISLNYGWRKSRKETASSSAELSEATVTLTPNNRQSVAKLAMAELAKRQNEKLQNSAKNTPKSPISNGGPVSPMEIQDTPGSPIKPKSPTKPISLSMPPAPQATGVTSNGNVEAVNIDNHEFRRPADPPVRSLGGHNRQAIKEKEFREQIAKIMPKFSNRKGRPMSRRNVISRQLLANRPLQPQRLAPSNAVKLRLPDRNAMPPHLINGQQLPPGAIIVAQSQDQHALINGLPTSGVVQGAPVSVIMVPADSQQISLDPQTNGHQGASVVTNLQHIVIQGDANGSAEVAPPPSRPAPAVSPSGSISSLFDDISSSSSTSGPATAAAAAVTSSDAPSTPKGDHFLDSVLENSNSSVLHTPTRVRPTPPTSPSRAINDSGWLPELSLSSFLQLGESPAKNVASSSTSSSAATSSTSAEVASSTSGHNPNVVVAPQPVVVFNEDSSHSTSSEVDRQLLSMMSENSVDFTAKFSRLAEHVNSEAD